MTDKETLVKFEKVIQDLVNYLNKESNIISNEVSLYFIES